ncbi:AraC family transcriptional regulator ligand-binding domain-containing protein [Aquabacterium sp.]|uniref:AraC family transcriptional regulator n=1 Tax=Aquabacterium sp. TaxID=1872578 RepID=UPI003784C4D5
MTALVRSASLTRFAELCAACGLAPRALLREVGLPTAALDEPDLMVPARRVGQLLELAAERGREPAFGLRMAETRQLSNLGPLGLLVRDEPTLRSALEAITGHLHLQNEALSLRVEELGGLVTLREQLDTEGQPARRQAVELVVGVTYRVLSLFMGAHWRPRLVCFTHRAPAKLAVHRRVFGSAVEFGHEFDGIVCNSADLDAPNPGADPVMSRYTQRLLAQVPRQRPRAVDRVRELIVLLLPRGHCRVETVAQHLGVDRRTVARHLAAEGASFSALVDGVRGELLARYLKDGARPLGEVAALLGFSEASAFSRWHRARFGHAARTLLRGRDAGR